MSAVITFNINLTWLELLSILINRRQILVTCGLLRSCKWRLDVKTSLSL